MKYLFVLGRNPQLSCAEILSCFERDRINVKSYLMKANGLLVELDGKIDIKKMINKLGGTIAIGKVLLSENKKKVLNDISKKAIYFEKGIKFNYLVMNFAPDEIFNDVLDAIEANFRSERLKARRKGLRGRMKMQDGEIVLGTPSGIKEKEMNYFVFSSDNEIDFGLISEIYNVKESEKIDMSKPIRREELAISPRLARILINLSQVKKGETLLDPFCGIGAILGEALLQGINVIGVDIDKIAIWGALKNIRWLRDNYGISSEFKILNEDSLLVNLIDFGINGIATEPSLGKLLLRVPQREEGLHLAHAFENLIVNVLNNLKKFAKKDAKIAFTSPLIRTQNGKVSCDINEICRRTGLEIYHIKNDLGIKFPIPEFREGQIVGREVCVLEVK